MIRRLQRQFVAIAMVSLLFIIVAIVSALNGFSLRQTNSTADAILDLLAANGGVFPDADAAVADSDLLLTPETRFETRYFAVFIQPDGTISSVLTDNIASTTVEQAGEYARQVLEEGRERGYLNNFRYLVADDGQGLMLLFLDRQLQLRSLQTMLELSCVIGAVALLVMFLLVYYLSRRAVRPVIESVEKQKRFITDAGHELKTPLAIISADTEVLEMSGRNDQWTASIRHQVERLNSLVAELLALSRLEEGRPRREFRELTLSALVMETAESFEPMAEAQGKLLELNITPGLLLRGDETALRQLVSVLVDNAIKYSPPGGEISLSLTRSGRYPLLEIINDTERLPEGDLSQLFERFYRADQSRSRDSGGYGVGLSIAQAVADEHRAKISVRALEGNKIAFSVAFTRA